MKTIKVKDYSEIPDNFTGVAEYEDAYRTKEWYKEGKLHREDGPACEFANGTKFWRIEGIRHRTDGPAVEWQNGTKLWYKEDKLHREDGPACEYSDGTKEWWIDGIEYYPIKLDDEIIVLDYLKGAHNIMWYKILIENGIMGYPDIPGLIDKE